MAMTMSLRSLLQSRTVRLFFIALIVIVLVLNVLFLGSGRNYIQRPLDLLRGLQDEPVVKDTNTDVMRASTWKVHTGGKICSVVDEMDLPHEVSEKIATWEPKIQKFISTVKFVKANNDQIAGKAERPAACRKQLRDYLCVASTSKEMVEHGYVEQQKADNLMDLILLPDDLKLQVDAGWYSFIPGTEKFNCDDSTLFEGFRISFIIFVSEWDAGGKDSGISLATLEFLLVRFHIPGFSFFVHVDGKSSKKFYRKVQRVMRGKGLQTNWAKNVWTLSYGGAGQVDATIAAMIQAQDNDCPHVMININGDDFPAMWPGHMLEWLKAHKNQNFIRWTTELEKTKVDKYNDYFWMHDCQGSTWSSRVHSSGGVPSTPDASDATQTGPQTVDPFLSEFLNSSLRYQQLVQWNNLPDNWTPSAGSHWFVFTKDFLEWFFTDPLPRRLWNFFKYWHVPEETYFPTVLKLSPFANTLDNEHPYHHTSPASKNRMADEEEIRLAREQESLFVGKIPSLEMLEIAKKMVYGKSIVPGTADGIPPEPPRPVSQGGGGGVGKDPLTPEQINSVMLPPNSDGPALFYDAVMEIDGAESPPTEPEEVAAIAAEEAAEDMIELDMT